MGYYNEHPTMVGGLICESGFFGLRTLSLLIFVILAFADGCEVLKAV